MEFKTGMWVEVYSDIYSGEIKKGQIIEVFEYEVIIQYWNSMYRTNIIPKHSIKYEVKDPSIIRRIIKGIKNIFKKINDSLFVI